MRHVRLLRTCLVKTVHKLCWLSVLFACYKVRYFTHLVSCVSFSFSMVDPEICVKGMMPKRWMQCSGYKKIKVVISTLHEMINKGFGGKINLLASRITFCLCLLINATCNSIYFNRFQLYAPVFRLLVRWFLDEVFP